MPSYIWICRIRADGSVLCTEPVRDLPSTTNVYTRLVPDGSGGAIAVWEDHCNGMKLYAQRVNDGVEELWQRNGMPVCSSLPEVSPRFEAIDSGNGNVAVAWIDGDRNLYAQMLDETGRKQWGDQGIPIAENVCEQPIVLTRVMQKEMLAGWCTGKSMHMPQRSFIQRLDIEGNTIGEPIGIGS